ncbi:MAG: hypothetical protein JXQ73_14455 [Phycisphaerae bacterium]|nr:hypothetical protein [Phycisphaerae bacterium]
MNRTVIALVVVIAVFALFGARRAIVRGSDLEDSRAVPSQELKQTHPLALEKPTTLVTPPYHKPANLPGDWWRLHHPLAQLRGDFNTVECQKCHDVDKYCNRCHGYVGVKSVAPLAQSSTSRPASKPAGR